MKTVDFSETFAASDLKISRSRHLIEYIPEKIRNATRRTDQLSGRSHVMGQFRLYRCKGISGTAALHIVCNQASKMYTRKLAKNQVGVKL